MPDVDPDHPSCSRCLRYATGPRRGRVFIRCFQCAMQAGAIRDAAPTTRTTEEHPR